MVRWIISHAEYTEFRNPDFQLRTANFYIPGLFSGGEAALGITISRKAGKAVQRNLLKRRIKAWVREHKELIPQGIKFVLSARSGATELAWQDLCTQLTSICASLQKRAMA